MGRCMADTVPALPMCGGQVMAPISSPSALLTRTSASGASSHHTTHTPLARHLRGAPALANSKRLALIVVVEVGRTRLDHPSRSSRVLMTDLFRLHAWCACCNTATTLLSTSSCRRTHVVQDRLSCPREAVQSKPLLFEA